jgi:hypothetical protein
VPESSPTENNPTAPGATILTSSPTTVATANTELDVSSIQVSTGISTDTTDIINNGIAIKLRCFNSSNRSISINKMEAIFNIYLYDSDNNLRYDNFGNQTVVRYFPSDNWNDIGWIPLDDFVRYYQITGLYRKFEGKVKLVVILNGRQFETYNHVRIYLKGYQTISQKEYAAFEAVSGSPTPGATPSINLSYSSQYPGTRATDVSTSPTFTWIPSSIFDNLYTYNFRLATDPDYINIIDSKTGLPNIYTPSVLLESGKTYYYAIQEVPIMPADFWIKNSFTTK